MPTLSGSTDANMRLSKDRAAAVVDYLTSHDGIAPERLSSVGKGSSEPLNLRVPTAPKPPCTTHRDGE